MTAGKLTSARLPIHRHSMPTQVWRWLVLANSYGLLVLTTLVDIVPTLLRVGVAAVAARRAAENLVDPAARLARIRSLFPTTPQYVVHPGRASPIATRPISPCQPRPQPVRPMMPATTAHPRPSFP